MKKIIFAALACILAFSSVAHAEEAAAPAMMVNKFDNDYTTENWAENINSYLYVNPSGGITRVAYVDYKNFGDKDTKYIAVEDYDSSFNLISKKQVPTELSLFGGFYAGNESNFLIFGQSNPQESDSTEVIRVVKYTKDWQRVAQASLYGANTSLPFIGGSLRCDESDGILYVHTCHEMYKSSDGLHHQANLSFSVNEKDMKTNDSRHSMSNISTGYVSHSFNQFIIVDQNKNIVTVDHGDAHPRAAVLCKHKMSGGKVTSSQNSILQEYSGEIGNNFTNSTVGGLAETNNNYITVYTYSGMNVNNVRVKCAYAAITDKNSMKTTIKQLSNLYSVATPVIAPIDNNSGYVMWNNSTWGSSDDTLYYVKYADGNFGEVKTAKGFLSDCQPIVYNNKLVWYTCAGIQGEPNGQNSTDYYENFNFYADLIFYSMDDAGVTSKTIRIPNMANLPYWYFM